MTREIEAVKIFNTERRLTITKNEDNVYLYITPLSNTDLGYGGFFEIDQVMNAFKEEKVIGSYENYKEPFKFPQKTGAVIKGKNGPLMDYIYHRLSTGTWYCETDGLTYFTSALAKFKKQEWEIVE